MIYYLILRVIFGAYIIVSSALLYMIISNLFFSKDKISRRILFFLKMLVLVILWPLSLFSKAGRKSLFSKIKGKF